MRPTYEREETGPSISASIQENDVSLRFKPDLNRSEGTWEKDGWELKLLMRPPKVRKKPSFITVYYNKLLFSCQNAISTVINQGK